MMFVLLLLLVARKSKSK